jgi:hypothetical protein
VCVRALPVQKAGTLNLRSLAFPFFGQKKPITKFDVGDLPHSPEDARAVNVLRDFGSLETNELLCREDDENELSLYLRNTPFKFLIVTLMYLNDICT